MVNYRLDVFRVTPKGIQAASLWPAEFFCDDNAYRKLEEARARVPQKPRIDYAVYQHMLMAARINRVRHEETAQHRKHGFMAGDYLTCVDPSGATGLTITKRYLMLSTGYWPGSIFVMADDGHESEYLATRFVLAERSTMESSVKVAAYYSARTAALALAKVNGSEP